MSSPNEIVHNGKVVARKIDADSWSEGLGFYSQESEYLQVGTWNYNEGKQLQRHVHNELDRVCSRTHEVLYIRAGSLRATIYSDDHQVLGEFVLNANDALILLDCGHGYEILEDKTKVIEIKNGPYLGADKDRRRF